MPYLFNNQPFYYGTVTKCVVAFGNLFSNISIQRFNGEGVVQGTYQVPVSYGPKEKFLARAKQQPNIDIATEELSLPRIAFEITGIVRDASRQMNAMQQLQNGQGSSIFNPVPYNLNINLYCVAKTQTDALQMMEQILPMFTPSYILKINQIPALNLVNDLPITLNSVDLEDDYDAPNFAQRRLVMITCAFTLQTSFYGPTTANTGGIIKNVQVNLVPNMNVGTLTGAEVVDVAVNPSSANQDGSYTITTSIEGFDGVVHTVNWPPITL
jgi:hypothetical protein